jgi:hypothetical protein
MTNKNTYILLGASILSTFVAGGLIFLAYTSIQKKNTQAVVLSQNIQLKLIEQENLTQFKNVIKETNEKHQILKSYIVDQDRIDELVIYLESKGDSLGVPIEIKNVEILNTKANTIAITFDGEGDFGNLMNLVWVIENLPYNVEISSFSVNSDLLGGWKINMKLEFTSNQTIQQNENPGL